jgi:hypothetical protein
METNSSPHKVSLLSSSSNQSEVVLRVFQDGLRNLGDTHLYTSQSSRDSMDSWISGASNKTSKKAKKSTQIKNKYSDFLKQEMYDHLKKKKKKPEGNNLGDNEPEQRKIMQVLKNK